MAKQLANPVAALISVPIELDVDADFAGDGDRRTLIAKPVIPIDLGADWNLISRTIVPLIDVQDAGPGGQFDESGLGDVQQSLFFSPKAPTAGGWIWGAGPVLLLPTATEDVLGNEKWGAGPTAVALRQQGPWTYGALVNHVWDLAGESRREDVNRSFMQPFVSYTTPSAMTISLNTESTYDWESEDWSVPINLQVSQVVKAGSQLLQLKGGVRYWAASPGYLGPDGWGFKIGIVFLFPR